MPLAPNTSGYQAVWALPVGETIRARTRLGILRNAKARFEEGSASGMLRELQHLHTSNAAQELMTLVKAVENEIAHADATEDPDVVVEHRNAAAEKLDAAIKLATRLYEEAADNGKKS